MKQFLLIAWLFPTASWAQDTLRPGVVLPGNDDQVLRGTVNPRGLELATRTVLYRQLRDTLASRPAKRLRSDDTVIIRREGSKDSLKVTRNTKNPFNFACNTATYYMPKSGAIDSKRFILL